MTGDMLTATGGSEATPTGRGRLLGLDPQALAGVALFVGFLTALALPMLKWWRWEYTKPDSYYGYATFVPAIVAFMLWARRKELAAAPKAPFKPALVLTGVFLALLLVAVKQEMQAVMSGAFLLTIFCATWSLIGTRAVKGPALFPLLYLWLMAPLPGPLLNDLTLNVQRLSTIGAAKLLTILFFHPVQDGNIIRMENFTLHVDVPCSGFKLLLTLLTFSSAFAYLTDTTLLKRWALFLWSLPLSVFVNSVRIMMIGVVGECIGSDAAHTFHDWSGMISLVLCAALLFGTAKALKCRTFAGQPIF